MEGLNRCSFLGNLGDNPELRVTQTGTAILKMRLACTTSFVDRNNARQERTEWVSATVFGKRGEGLAKILHKGDRLFVEGELRTSSYEKDGEKRYRTEIVANNVLLCGSGGKPAGEQQPARTPAPSRAAEPRPAPPPPDDFGGFGGSDQEVPY